MDVSVDAATEGGPHLIVPARILHPCQERSLVLREEGTLQKLVLVPSMLMLSFMCSISHRPRAVAEL